MALLLAWGPTGCINGAPSQKFDGYALGLDGSGLSFLVDIMPRAHGGRWIPDTESCEPVTITVLLMAFSRRSSGCPRRWHWVLVLPSGYLKTELGKCQGLTFSGPSEIPLMAWFLLIPRRLGLPTKPLGSSASVNGIEACVCARHVFALGPCTALACKWW